MMDDLTPNQALSQALYNVDQTPEHSTWGVPFEEDVLLDALDDLGFKLVAVSDDDDGSSDRDLATAMQIIRSYMDKAIADFGDLFGVSSRSPVSSVNVAASGGGVPVTAGGGGGWSPTLVANELSQRCTDLGGRLRELEVQNERLRDWKASAIETMVRWDSVWEALGKPGPLGASKAANSLAEVERLLDIITAMGKECSELHIHRCTGAGNCDAPVHIHGCYADTGNCDDPTAVDHQPSTRPDNASPVEGWPSDEAVERATAAFFGHTNGAWNETFGDRMQAALKATGSPPGPIYGPYPDADRRAAQDLRAQLADRDAEIERLRTELATVKEAKVAIALPSVDEVLDELKDHSLKTRSGLRVWDTRQVREPMVAAVLQVIKELRGDSDGVG